MNFFKVFIAFGAFSRWLEKATADGKITPIEWAQLGQNMGQIFGLPTDITIPGLEPSPESDTPVATGPETPESETATETRTEKPPHKPIGGYTT